MADNFSQFSLPISPRPKRIRGLAKPAGTLHQVAGLFAGIGGIELGLSRSGHATQLLCENDPAAQAVLRARFPDIRLREDVRDIRSLPPATTLIAAGFPCQDLSQAGSTRGIEGSRSGLIGEVFRLVRRHKTPWILLENVPFMLQLAKGEAMNVITSAFEDLGYQWAYRTVDSRAFGLPQRRRRVFFVASRVGDPRTVLFADEAHPPSDFRETGRSVAYGFYWTEGVRGLGWAVDGIPTLKGGSTIGIPSAPAIWGTDGRIATPEIRDAERLQGFRANWTKPAEEVAKRGARWKLVGNAVNVRVAEWVGRRFAKPGIPLCFETRSLEGHRTWPSAAWSVDGVRSAVIASDWPVQYAYRSLEDFLAYPLLPLSVRATSGFLQRTNNAKLRFPPGFLDALRDHLKRMYATSDVSESESQVEARAA